VTFPIDYCGQCSSEDLTFITAGVAHWLVRCNQCGSEWTLTDEELMDR
jgi:uncharacterized Zn finger protein